MSLKMRYFIFLLCIVLAFLFKVHHRRETSPRKLRILSLKNELYEEFKNWSIPEDSLHIQDALVYTQFTMASFVWRKPSLLCFATQMSVDRLLNMFKVAINWKGRMAISVYTPGTDFTKAKIILWLLQHCMLSTESELVIYFAFPIKHAPVDEPRLWDKITPEICRKLTMIGDLLEVKKETPLYPFNNMRNIATVNCNTEYVVYADNDMIPNPGLSTAMQPILSQWKACKKCCFVIPVYELNETVTFLPTNKAELLQMIGNDLARPFYWTYSRAHQGTHDPKRWESLTNSAGVRVAYPISKYTFHYEPVYIAKKPIPLFDSRFIGHGFDRVTQMLEMVAAGYTFYLLDNVFMMHLGRGHSRLNHSQNCEEWVVNHDRFKGFVKELFTTYGMTDLVEEVERSTPEKVLLDHSQDIYERGIQQEIKNRKEANNQKKQTTKKKQKI